MIIELAYKPEYDAIPDEEFLDAINGFFALSSTVDKAFGLTSHKVIIDRVAKENPDVSREQLWYLFVLNLLKFRACKMHAEYLESLIKEVIIRYRGKNPPEDIALLVGQINNTLPSDGIFISVSESINDDDIVINNVVQAKDEIKESCEQYFQCKNLSREFIEKTVGADKIKNKYVNWFDMLFDMMLMVCLNSVDEILEFDLAEDEKAVRDFLFSTIKAFTDQTFTKYKDKIYNNIINILSQYKLAAEDDD